MLRLLFADQGSSSNRWVGVGPTSHVFDPHAETMICSSNSLAAEGGREPIHKDGDRLHPSG
jgi:hypothetical protein